MTEDSARNERENRGVGKKINNDNNALAPEINELGELAAKLLEDLEESRKMVREIRADGQIYL